MTHSFLERIGQPEVDLANHREESVSFNVHDDTSIPEFSSSQMFSMLFRDLLVCKLAGFLKTLEYWQRDKFWDLVSRFLILCLEMLETSALGLGQDLGLLLVLEGAMTNSTYVSRFSFILIPYRFKVRDRCFVMLQGFSLSPAFEKHSGLTTDVRSQNCCSCLDANNLICDRGIRTEVSRKSVHGKKRFPS
ncbi:hypothetical protein F2Q70_00029703 [Brassica cretica]|uniref:Uncharacterized protein n=1 Tax=Brassica cretica TaxID=69181 RepID=A0A8S9FG82_BRACR|nr:hypothetical protein F2Q70_00029703 [Brassica cretica]